MRDLPARDLLLCWVYDGNAVGVSATVHQSMHCFRADIYDRMEKIYKADAFDDDGQPTWDVEPPSKVDVEIGQPMANLISFKINLRNPAHDRVTFADFFGCRPEKQKPPKGSDRDPKTMPDRVIQLQGRGRLRCAKLKVQPTGAGPPIKVRAMMTTCSHKQTAAPAPRA